MPEKSDILHGQEEKTILVVEDMVKWQERIRRSLRLGGYVVKLASHPDEAIKTWEEEKPDLVITDLSFVEGDGVDEQGMDLVAWIRKRDPLIPIFITSAYPTVERIRRAFSAFRVDDFFLKSDWSRTEFFQAVRKALDRTALQRAKAVIGSLKEENAALRNELYGLGREKDQLDEEPGVSKTISKELKIYRSFILSFLHDLGSEIGGFSDDIEDIRLLPDLPAEGQEALERMRRRLPYIRILRNRMASLLEIRVFALHSVPSTEIIERIQSLAEPRMPASVALSVDVKPSAERVTIKTDKEHVVGVVLELIQNASKVLSNDGGRIEVLAEGEDDKVILSIKDNGPGIPKDLRDMILKETVQSKHGSGLGLYLSNKVIETLGGTLRLESTSSEGTVFSISLPVSDMQEED